MKISTLNKIISKRKTKDSFALVTYLNTEEEYIVDLNKNIEVNELDKQFIEKVRELIVNDRSTILDSPEGPAFVNIFNAPLRLIIVGAAHIAESLAKIASLIGYDVFVIEPRTMFLDHKKFIGCTLISKWPDEAIASLGMNTRTAVVTLTHDPKIDDPALKSCLNTPVFYIGALGSNRTNAARFERLRNYGFHDDTIKKIHGPVGLRIGAKSPSEIAVSIMAEITKKLHMKENYEI